ncbi:hypothetical protein [Streptomyces sp. NPDC047315]|uniref:hypothetical protein n=1 Tax=Streptomyces sp. NPDC047315 TaxID=3155142 RepID=UPI0033EC3FEB
MAVFTDGTTFRSTADFDSVGERGYVQISFSIAHTPLYPVPPEVNPVDIANAISAVIQAAGYRRAVFSGPQVEAVLNP